MTYIYRDIEAEILPKLENSKALFILGARQVGKTSLLKRLMQQKGKDCSLYYDMELPSNLELFEGRFEDILGRLRFDKSKASQRTYVFIDEVQYLKDFSKIVKLFVDHYSEEFKLVLTGSSSLLIKHQFSESLVGRKEIVTLWPLSFGEFCRFKGEEKIAEYLDKELIGNPLLTKSPEMERLLEEFCLFGGYPEVVNQGPAKQKMEVLNDIVSSYIIKDIKHILRLEKIQELNKLIVTLAMSIGKEISISELSRNVGLHRESIQKYLMVLEESFILHTIRPFFSSLDKEMRKMPKIYLADTGLRNMLVQDFRAFESRADIGEIVENAFLLNLIRSKGITDKIHYWKTKQGSEVDFVIRKADSLEAYEVKFGRGTQNHYTAFKNAYPGAKCKTIRYKYQYKENELPLWYQLGE